MPQICTMTADPRGRRLPAAALVVALAVSGCLPTSIRPTLVPEPSVPPVTSAPPATPSPTPGPPTPTPGPSFATYTVVRGDNLTSVAKKFHTSPRSLAYWNRAKYPTLDPESAKYAPDNLKAGWVLQVIPSAEYSPPPNDGETGIDATPSPPDDGTDAPGASAGASASPGASAGG
jgi:LysM domain